MGRIRSRSLGPWWTRAHRGFTSSTWTGHGKAGGCRRRSSTQSSRPSGRTHRSKSPAAYGRSRPSRRRSMPGPHASSSGPLRCATPAWRPRSSAGSAPIGSLWRWTSPAIDPSSMGGSTQPASARRFDALRGLADAGVTSFEVTAVERDGMLVGPDLDLLRRLVGLDHGRVIASGGITTLEDLRAVRDLGCAGAIVGRAIYEGALDLGEAMEAVATAR